MLYAIRGEAPDCGKDMNVPAPPEVTRIRGGVISWHFVLNPLVE